MNRKMLGGVLLGVIALGVLGGGGRNRVVEAPVPVRPAGAGITIDGKLEEWNRDEAGLLTLAESTTAGDGGSVYAPYSARVALKYDAENLYLGIWWQADPERRTARLDFTPPIGDGLVLSTGRGENPFLALFRDPATKRPTARSLKQPLAAEGRTLPEVRQAFAGDYPVSYTQEAAIPWSVLGIDPARDPEFRLGVDLLYSTLDSRIGYDRWFREKTTTTTSGNRWGGGLCWGFMDGLDDKGRKAPGFDPNTGAEVVLMGAGAAAPANEPEFYAGNEQTRTTGMIAVPAGRISVDGRLDPAEWNEAAGTTLGIEPTLFPHRYQTRVFWSYAPEGLYVGLRFLTGGSHLNVNDPAKIRNGYDGGDAVQLRLAVGGRVSHTDAWYFDAGKTPAVAITYGVRFEEGSVPDAIAAGAKTAVRNLPGGGYEQELFLPWSLITPDGKALRQNDRFRAVLDLFYSGNEGNRLPFIITARTVPDHSVLTLPQPVEPGVYTVVIEDASGRVVRRLLEGVRLGRGDVLGWDGLDDRGEAVPPGTYRFRGLRHDGLKLNYLMTYNNPGNPPWQTPDGKGEWGGDHCPPQGVAIDGDRVYLGWSAAEDGSGLIGLDLEGQRQWGFFQSPHPAGSGATQLAAADGRVYYLVDVILRSGRSRQRGEQELAYFGTLLSVHDARTGNCVDWSLEQPYRTLREFSSAEAPVRWFFDLREQKQLTPDSAWHRDFYYFSQRAVGANGAGIAVRDGRIYVSLRLDKVIKVFDAKTMKELAAWPAVRPGALTFSPGGELFALVDDAVVQLDPATGKVLRTAVPASELTAPAALAVGPDGRIYVGEWGERQCVRVFDRAGKFLHQIGKTGGRGWVGRLDFNGMLFPMQLALDTRGRLWVTENEESPRRVSVWEAATGRFLRHFIGGSSYGGVTGGYLDPADPTIAFANNTVFKLDYEHKRYEPVATMFRRTSRHEVFDSEQEIGSCFRVLRREGRTYLLTGSKSASVIGELTADFRFIPRAAIGGIFNRSDNAMALAGKEEQLEWRMFLPPPEMAGKGGYNYIWTDLNGDGKLQPEEFEWRKFDSEIGLLGLYWSSGVSRDDFSFVLNSENPNRFILFPVTEWLPNGAPRYRFSNCRPLGSYSGRLGSYAMDREGNILTNQFGEWRAVAWYKGDTHLRSVTPEGKLNWELPTLPDHRAPGAITGEKILGPFESGGELGEVFTFTQWHGCRLPLVTTDGLFVDKVLRDPAEGGASGPDLYRGETIQALTRLDDGRLILAHGKNAHHLFEIQGLREARRFSGEFTLSPEQAARATALLAAAKSEEQAAAPVPVVRGTARVDGKLDEWQEQPATPFGGEQTPNGRFRARYDDRRLYLAYEVNKHGPYRNQGTNVQQLFLSGDAVDLQFNSDPLARPGAAMREGDRRIVFAKYQGRPVAVLYESGVPGAERPVTFNSPTRGVRFDRVSEIREAEVAIVDTPSGYVVEASVPLRPVVVENFIWPNRRIASDFGAVIGDETGRRVARIYRYNRDTRVVNDIPTESELISRNWGALHFQAEEEKK